MTAGASLAAVARWLDSVDPGVHRRIKGLRLVTAFGIAALLGALHDVAGGLPDGASLSTLAGGIALWASVSEGRATRQESGRDLALLVAAAVLGATFTAGLTPVLAPSGPAGPELTLVAGAFLVGYLRRFGVLGAGIGSQIYIGQLLAYGLGLTPMDLPMLGVAGLIAAVAAIVPRMLSGPAERPVLAPAAPRVASPFGMSPEFVMGLQAASAATAIVLLNGAFGLAQSVWAITASTFVVASTASGTIERIRRRIVGTAIGVPIGLACLPIALHAPILVWVAAAIAMVIYAMAMPQRYDIACGAFAFTLIVTMAANGEHSIAHLAARLWETLLGGAVGLATAVLVFPLRPNRD
ncbi:MAG: LysR family transcriptional regulator [Rubritepida sp.]|nr:LysR family transcriptional regulator [Rubritepida sp.]